MGMYRKKPIVIEAIRLEGIDTASLHPIATEFAKDEWGITVQPDPIRPCIHVKTLEGVMCCNVGDWLIRGIAGELYPCKAHIFETTYEEVAT
jgi:hypothetical protein